MSANYRFFSEIVFKKFSNDEQGSMTVWGLFVWLVCGILGAIALDYTHLVSARTHLQVVTEQAAHAAILQRYRRGEDADVAKIKSDAVELAKASLPPAQYGTALTASDIEFGIWDPSTQQFTVDETQVDAVRARAYFNRDRGNAATSFLFRLIGRDNFNVAAESIFIAEGENCLSEGYVALGKVDVQSGNEFLDGFCIHSDDHVSVNQGNKYSYKPGTDLSTIVSMPNIADMDIPGGVTVDDEGNVIDGDFSGNVNLDKILEREVMPLETIINGIDEMISMYKNPDLANETSFPYSFYSGSTFGWPSYILPGDEEPVMVTPDKTGGGGQITTAEILNQQEELIGDDGVPVMVPTGDGRVYNVGCGANGVLTIDATDPDVPFEDIVLISDCKITFKQGSSVANSRIMTTSTAWDSIQAPSDFQIGNPTACGDGVQFLTLGSVQFAAQVNFVNSQIIAREDIKFTANADGSGGVSLIAGGTIDATSNGKMDDCDTGLSENFAFKQFRRVR